MAWRLSLILFGGLLAAHALSFGLLFYERHEAASSMLMTNVEHDVGVAVNMLDRLPPGERASALPILHRRTITYVLGPGETAGPPPKSALARGMTERIEDESVRYLFLLEPVTPEQEQEQERKKQEVRQRQMIFSAPSVEPARKAAAATAEKVGRNEACPCGSGRKYKRCHGA